MSEIFKKSIIKFLKHSDYVPLKLAKLAKALNVAEQEMVRFEEAFDQLLQAGNVVVGAGGGISLPQFSGEVTGIFRANPKGFGFVRPSEPAREDLFIPAKAVADAMNGDTVVARVTKSGQRQGQTRSSGQIIEILQRGQSRIVGTLLKEKAGWFVHPDGQGFAELIGVSDIAAKNARENDKVVVEILSYPTPDVFALGVITEVLGKAGRYETEIKSVIHRFNLAGEFDAACLGQARKAAELFKPDQPGKREDISEKVIITIDPETAKDFDDAISLEKDPKGHWVLGVHIADVSNFISPDSAMDIEAKERGNSVYLPNWTIPMLPEILSNGICSLQPGQKRFAKSAYITYDSNAKILNTRFANSVICSTQRLTYEEAEKILKGKVKDIPGEVVKLLKDMEKLSQLIEKRRFEKGMLHLDLPEIELVMDKSGQVVDAHPADTSYPHTIIEMFMVEANEAVAGLLDRLNVPFMRRIHPEPNSLSMQKLSKLARSFGINMPKVPDRFAIQAMLTDVMGEDCSVAINLVTLRSMEKAQYSPLHIGHYALASTHYCHFTSPIRRYADLLVHRLLDGYIKKQSNQAADDNELSFEQLTEIGKHLDTTERQADDAEEDLKAVLILKMLSKHIGDELDCVVTGVAGFGVFLQSKKYGIEGLIPIDDLGADQWEFNQMAQAIVGRNSGYIIKLGIAIKACIVSVNIPARQLNLLPAEALVKSRREKKKSKAKPGKKDGKRGGKAKKAGKRQRRRRSK